MYLFLLQSEWQNGEPVTLSFWSKKNRLVHDLQAYILMNSYHNYSREYLYQNEAEYNEQIQRIFRQLSGGQLNVNEIDLRLSSINLRHTIKALSIMHKPIGWTDIFTAIHQGHSNTNNNCTFAYFNPLSNSQLEWARINCSTNLSISNIMCRQNSCPKQNKMTNGNEVVVYADASYYNYDSWTSNHTHTDSLCPVEVRKRLMNTVISCTGKTINFIHEDNTKPRYTSQYFVYANTIVKTVCTSLKGNKSQIWIEFCMFQMQNIKEVTQSYSVTIVNLTIVMTTRKCPRNHFMINDLCFSLTGTAVNQWYQFRYSNPANIEFVQKLIAKYNIESLTTTVAQIASLQYGLM